MTETCEPSLIQTIQQACMMMQVLIDSVHLQTGWDHPIACVMMQQHSVINQAGFPPGLRSSCPATLMIYVHGKIT